jgi:hypothetical protein
METHRVTYIILPETGVVRGLEIAWPTSPPSERAVQRKFLHLLPDFSQQAFSGDMSGNSADISKGSFYKPIGGSNPLFAASTSLI